MANHEDLYEQDFYAWTQAQAEALRRREAGANALDYDRLAEEVADLGSEQLHACASWVVQILLHFLKIEHSAFNEPTAGWRKEIVAARDQLEDRLTATIRNRLEQDLPRLYRRAVKQADAAFAADEPETEPKFPPTCPYSLEEVLGTDWFPERPPQ